jgi:hypothetical protein
MDKVKSECKHPDFDATVVVNKLPDVNRYIMDLKLSCKECKEPFIFLGLPFGVDLTGASVSIDGTEARLAIAPKSQGLSGLDKRVRGFTVERIDDDQAD